MAEEVEKRREGKYWFTFFTRLTEELPVLLGQAGVVTFSSVRMTVEQIMVSIALPQPLADVFEIIHVTNPVEEGARLLDFEPDIRFRGEHGFHIVLPNLYIGLPGGVDNGMTVLPLMIGMYLFSTDPTEVFTEDDFRQRLKEVASKLSGIWLYVG